MSRIKTLKPRVKSFQAPFRTTGPVKRITGRTLQNIRMKAWLKFPYCAMCGKPVGYPNGFELDHVIPLYKGGEEVETNRQILCVDTAEREGCHTKKTREDMRK